MLHFGKSLGLFAVGQSLLSAIESVRSDLPNSKARVLYNEGAKADSPIVLLVQEEGRDLYVLRFDPALQILRSVAYTLPRSCTNENHEIRGTYNLSSKRSISVQSALDTFGKPKHFRVQLYKDQQEAVYLFYDGTCFVFDFQQPNHSNLSSLKELSSLKSQLVEIRVAPAMNHRLLELGCGISLAKRSVLDFQLPEVHLVVHEPSRMVTGLEIAYACSSVGDENVAISAKHVSFGEKSEDVLSNLGCPDHVYYNDQHHRQQMGTLTNYWNFLKYSDLHSEYCFCYRHLGIDVLFDAQRSQVSKIVLHTNIPDQFEFGFYCRCFFKFSISTNCVSTSRSGESLLVTPTTNWNVIRNQAESDHVWHLRICHYSPSTNTFYPFGDTSLWALFDQLIVETTSSNCVAKITLLAPDRSTVLSAKLVKQNIASTMSALHPDVREEETEFEVKVRKELQIDKSGTSDTDEEFQDCQEESFHSAESSLATAYIETESSTKTQDLKEEFTTVTITETAHFSQNVNVIVSDCHDESSSSISNQSSSAVVEHTPNTLIYEFLADEEENGTISNQPSEEATDFQVVHTSNTLQIVASTFNAECYHSVTDMPEDDDTLFAGSPIAASDDGEPPEHSSFDFISYSEVIESQRTLAMKGSPQDSDSDKLQDAMVDPLATTSEEEAQCGSEHPSIHQSSTQYDLDLTCSTKKCDSSSELDSQIDTMSKSSDEAVFHYQPRSTTMTASRIMTLSQDVGLFERQSHETTTTNKFRKHPTTKNASKPLSSSGTPHTNTKASGRGAPLSKSGEAHPLTSRQSGRLIVQRRAGSSASAHKEAKSRLLSHTKSSQQKTKTKYVPKVKEDEEEAKPEERIDQRSESGEEAIVESGIQCEEIPVPESVGHTLEGREPSTNQRTDSMTAPPWKETLDCESKIELTDFNMSGREHSSPPPQQHSQESDYETTPNTRDATVHPFHLDREGTHLTPTARNLVDPVHSGSEETHPTARQGSPHTYNQHSRDSEQTSDPPSHIMNPHPSAHNNVDKGTNEETEHCDLESCATRSTAVECSPAIHQGNGSAACKAEHTSLPCLPVETKGIRLWSNGATV